MKDIEKRAHDIACAVLSKTMVENRDKIVVPTGPYSYEFDCCLIVDDYLELYEGILMELRDKLDYD